MRHQHLVNSLMIFLLGMTGISCASTAKKVLSGTPSVIIQLEKTGCLGNCPVYTMTIYSDKTVSFKGIANTLQKGSQRDTLSLEKYDQIVRMFEYEAFITLDSAYMEPIVDAPFTYLSFRQKGKLKKVAVRGGAPDSFKRLVNQIESMARDASWLLPDKKDQNPIKEMIIEFKAEIDPEGFSKQFVDDKLTLIKKIAPNQYYYLFSIDSDDPEALLTKIRKDPQVKNAQWNHKLSKREK